MKEVFINNPVSPNNEKLESRKVIIQPKDDKGFKKFMMSPMGVMKKDQRPSTRASSPSDKKNRENV
jgi:hypothetical protein